MAYTATSIRFNPIKDYDGNIITSRYLAAKVFLIRSVIILLYGIMTLLMVLPLKLCFLVTGKAKYNEQAARKIKKFFFQLHYTKVIMPCLNEQKCLLSMNKSSDKLIRQDNNDAKLAAPAINEYNDVYLNSDLVLFSKTEVFYESLNSYDDFDSFIGKGRKGEKDRAFISRNSAKTVTAFNGKAALCFDHYYFNYSHFCIETIPRLYLLKNLSRDVILIVPRNEKKAAYDSSDFIEAVLKAYGLDNNPRISLPKAEEIIHFDQLIMPVGAKFHKELFNDAVNDLVENYRPEFKTSYGNKIYISRKPGIRNIKNIDKVEDIIINKYGFKKVIMEDHDFIQEMSIMQDAEYIVGPCTSGMTSNVIFTRKPVKTLEIRALDVTLYPLFVSSILSNKVDNRYLFCRKLKPVKSWYEADITVNLKKLDIALQDMLRA